MFRALIWTLIWKVEQIFYKKTCQYNITANLNDLFTYFWAFLTLLVMFLIWKFNIFLFRPIDYFLIFISYAISFVRIFIGQQVYKTEKISSLIPFSNISKILSILLWVLILWDKVSFISLLLFFIIIILILFSSFDIRNLKISKNILLYIFGQVLISFKDLTICFILVNNSTMDYYSVYIIFSFFVILSFTLYKRDFKYIKTLDKKYFLYSLWSSIWYVSTLISILVMKELWLTVSVILSFLWIWVSYLLSYLVFKDTPSKKDMLITLLVTILVFIAFILK